MDNFSQQAEEIVLGTMIMYPEKIAILSTELKPEYFYFAKNKIIFESILNIFRNGKSVDIITLTEELSSIGKLEYIGGVYYISLLSEHAFSLKSSLDHAKIIKEKYRMRSIIECLEENSYASKEGKINNSEELLSNITKKILSLETESISEKTSIIDSLNEFSNVQEEFANAHISGKTCIGIPTGYKKLDKIIDGYRPEHLISITGYTSTGKSSLMLNMVYKLLKQNKRVVIFSLEMSKVDMIAKILSIHTENSPNSIIKGYTDSENIYQTQKDAKFWLSSKKLTMYSEIQDIDDILISMQIEEMKEHVDVFFLDYIQNITSDKTFDEYKLLTSSIKSLQALNRKLKTTLVVLSQISNDTNKSSSTLNVEGKGSGAIKAASNLFLYLKRDVKDEDEVNNIIREGREMPLLCVINKNRHGTIGSFKLKMKPVNGIIYEPL